MTVLTEGNHAGGFLVSTSNKTRSFDKVIITGGSYEAGTVLGKITASGFYTQFDPAATDGSEVAVALLFDNVDASAADVLETIVKRDAEYNAVEIVWDTGLTPTEILAAEDQLEAVGIVPVTGV